ncbi:hypothetical protein NEOLEDRAFT_1140092 [Neolentinus lepideus HHB14362 ss-1]|uniref:Uncharacterized protein n=1 Tax=Neolentinus lepideus HHB14362 ss-1 TaxID=1314782 RepID=A0A165PEG4_9AGAM|nr:hypothetical protein NEOLEDRAFT_1140092 [Neolentinus lepideus HHB14362 ss-1]
MIGPSLPVSAFPKPVRSHSTNHHASNNPITSMSLSIPVGMSVTSPIPLPMPSRARPSTAPTKSTVPPQTPPRPSTANEPKPKLPHLIIPASRPTSCPQTPIFSPPATRTQQALRLLGGASGIQRVRAHLRSAYPRRSSHRSPRASKPCPESPRTAKPTGRRHSREHDLDLYFTELLIGEPLLPHRRLPKQKPSRWADKDYLALRSGLHPDKLRSRHNEKVEEWRLAVANAMAADEEPEETPALSPAPSLQLPPTSPLRLCHVSVAQTNKVEAIAQKPECTLTLDLHAEACFQAYLLLNHNL